MGNHQHNYSFVTDDSNREPRVNVVQMPMGARYYTDDTTHIVVEVPDINADPLELPISVWYGGQQLPFVVRQATGRVMPDDRNALLPLVNGVMVSDRHVGTVVMTNQTNGKEHKD